MITKLFLRPILARRARIDDTPAWFQQRVLNRLGQEYVSPVPFLAVLVCALPLVASLVVPVPLATVVLGSLLSGSICLAKLWSYGDRVYARLSDQERTALTNDERMMYARPVRGVPAR